MVTYNEAYSTKLKETLTAQYANEHFTGKNWDGSIQSKLFDSNNEFQCADNCDLQLTCVNIHVDFSNSKNYNRKRLPYFSNRSGGKHSHSCSRIIRNRKKRSLEKTKTRYYTQEGNKFIFTFTKGYGFPKQNFPSLTQEHNNSNNKSTYRTKQDPKMTNQHEKKQIPHVTSIKRMISLFEENEIGDYSIQLFDNNHQSINFYDIFFPIDSNVIDNIYTIFYGQAHAEFLTLKNNQQVIKLQYSKSISIDNYHFSKPSVLLYEDDFIKNKRKSLYKTFEKYANRWVENKKDKNSYFRLYYVGTFKEKNTYINFDSLNINIPKSLFIRGN
ncbi:hypothetical protein [Enterococcus thailandicus]|uniref:hypothetical protein n=1 Tax=Enterococcus thailandicus TaxID=417368 RepID=UPI003984EA79